MRPARKKRNDIRYSWGQDHLLIDLGNRIEPRIRALFWAEFLFTSGMATIFLMQSLPLGTKWIHWSTGLGASVLYLLASYRFLSRMYFREQVLLERSQLVLIQKGFMRRKVQCYDWEHVGPLHYVGKDKKTDHPLKGRNFDYFGFETHEHLIQSLYQDGSLYFNYGGFPVRFARGVYSWHAEEVVRMMKLYMGDVLQLGSEWAKMMQEQEWDDAQQL